MSIKTNGGIFGRNPTFNNVGVEGDLSIEGQLIVAGEVITGLDYQGGWNASTNNPDIAASSPVSGQFWIVTADGTTDVGGITNWTVGDWALFDGTSWQRVEGGNTDLDTGVSGTLKVLNGGTGANDAATARTNLGLVIGTDVEPADSTILKDADIGVTVQGYDATTLKSADIGVTVQAYDTSILTTADIDVYVQGYDPDALSASDIGVSVQGYDANTAKLDETQTWSGTQTFNSPSDGGVETIAQFNRPTYGLCLGIRRLAGDGGIFSNQNIHISADDDNDSTGESSNIIFEIDGSEKARINPAGNLVFANSGSGIDFSATGDASGMTSELLDDYEEGTWTATVGCTGNGTTTTTKTGYYTKIGRKVTVSFRNLNSISTTGLSGYLAVSLPYTCITADVGFQGPTGWSQLTYPSGVDNILAQTSNGASSMVFAIHGSGSSASLLDVSSISSGSTSLVALTLTYFTA